MASQKRILMLHTGGTLGMEAPGDGPLRPGHFERMLKRGVPELPRIADVDFEVFCNLDSSDLHPGLWSSLGERVFTALPAYDGVVITHGTDTMPWTAAALSFMLRGLRKPVILTGSQRPLGEVRTDARLNVIDAVTAAVSGPPEVCISFDSRLFRGNRARKIKINDYDAFESPNFPVLGTLGVDVILSAGRKPEGRARLMAALEPHVFLLKLWPGIPPFLPRQLLPAVKGLVVEGFGAGNFPVKGEGSLLPVFAEARDRGIPVVMISQARCNSVNLGLYEAGSEAARLGVIGGGDMTPEAAVVKLMHVLAHVKGLPAIRDAMERDLAGERS